MGSLKNRSNPPTGAAYPGVPSGAPRSHRRTVAVIAVGLLVTVYLVRFFSSGGQRFDIYRNLLGYILLPDALVTDLCTMWVGGSWSSFQITDRLPILGVAMWIGLTAILGGTLVLPRKLSVELSWCEYLAFAAGLGLQCVSLWTLMLGLAGLLRFPSIMWASTIAVWMVVAARTWREGPPLGELLAAIPRPSAGWLLVLPPLVLTLFLSALPPWEFDVREYHLQVPKEWFQQGRITFLPHNVYGNMPLGVELHALAAMMLMPGGDAWWYGALAGKIVTNGHTWVAALMIFAVARRYTNGWAAWSATTIYLSTPWIIHASAIGHVEGAMAAYYMLALAAVLRACPVAPNVNSEPRRGAACEPKISRERLAWGALAGFLAGSAVCCKYTAVVFVGVPLALALATLCGRMRWPSVAAYVLFAAVACGPWLAKNGVLAGNPVYPLLYSVFGGRDWDEATNGRWREAHGPPRNAQGQRYSLGQIESAVRDIGWQSDKLSPFLWPLAMLGLLWRTDRRLRHLLLALLAANLLVWWTLTHRYDRFLVPAFPLVALMSGFGAAWLCVTRLGQRLWMFVLAIGVIVNCVVVGTGALTGDNRILVKLELLRRDERQLLRTHPAHLFLNDHVLPGKRALMVGEAQVFDLEVPIYYHTCWNKCIFETWMKGKSRAERLRAFRDHDVSHVFFHWSEIARYREPGNYGFTDYVTRELVYQELVDGQRLLRPVPVRSGDKELLPASGEVFEVVDE